MPAMSCPACSRLVLGVFLRDTGVVLARPPARTLRPTLNRADGVRVFAQSSSRHYRSSASQRNGMETAPLFQPDDSYIPFETTATDGRIARPKSGNDRRATHGNPHEGESSTGEDSNVTDQRWIERTATSNFVPKVKLEGEFKDVDVRALAENHHLRMALHDDESDQHTSSQEATEPVTNSDSNDRSAKIATRRTNRTTASQSSASSQEAHQSNTTASETATQQTQTLKTTKKPSAEDKKLEKNKDREVWQIQKEALGKKFAGEGWKPRRKLSPDTLEGIRALNAQYPDKFTSPVLAKQFEVSPEVIRRILKSKWKPNPEEEESRRERWDRRGQQIWERNVALGIRPPKRWRMMGIGAGMPRPEHRRRRQMEQWKKRNAPKQEPIARGRGKTQSGSSIATRIL